MYRNSLTHQQGSMLVIALFVIIVLAMLGATMSKMVIASNVTLVTDLTGLRAKHAAQTGLEVLGSQSFPLDNSIQTCNTTVNSNAAFTGIIGFSNCAYTAACNTISITKSGIEHYFYRFTSVGTCGRGKDDGLHGCRMRTYCGPKMERGCVGTRRSLVRVGC